MCHAVNINNRWDRASHIRAHFPRNVADVTYSVARDTKIVACALIEPQLVVLFSKAAPPGAVLGPGALLTPCTNAPLAAAHVAALASPRPIKHDCNTPNANMSLAADGPTSRGAGMLNTASPTAPPSAK